MKKRDYIIGLTAIGAAAAAVYLIRKARQQHKLNIVADAGYETAHDIIFPSRENKSYKASKGADKYSTY